jgi:hypothetical protein
VVTPAVRLREKLLLSASLLVMAGKPLLCVSVVVSPVHRHPPLTKSGNTVKFCHSYAFETPRFLDARANRYDKTLFRLASIRLQKNVTNPEVHAASNRVGHIVSPSRLKGVIDYNSAEFASLRPSAGPIICSRTSNL